MPTSSPSSAGPLELLGGPRGAEDGAAHRVRELDGRRADAAADRVDQDPLARPQTRLRLERVVRGDEDLGDGRGLLEARGSPGSARPSARGVTTYSACPPPPTIPKTRSPTWSGPVTPGPSASTSPANSSPGMSAGDARRRGVMAPGTASGRPGSARTPAPGPGPGLPAAPASGTSRTSSTSGAADRPGDDRRRSSFRPVIPPVPVDPDVVRRAAAGDDVGAAVAVEVGGDEVLAADAAVVDHVPGEGQRGRAPGFGS